MRECELVWNVVNAEDKSMRDIGTMRFKNIRTLDRQAFIQCIVRLTIAKYVHTRLVPDVSSAVERLFRDITPRLPEEATHNTNVFRGRYCYLREVDHVLRRHLGSIKCLYTRYAALTDTWDHKSDGTLVDDTLMDVGEWMTFLDHFGLFEKVRSCICVVQPGTNFPASTAGSALHG